MDSYNTLIQRLDRFIKKYYLNKVIRGGLLFTGLVLFLLILFSFLEYQFYFDRIVRKLLFFSFLGVGLISLWSWILSPLLKYFRLGQVISHEKAAEIVGAHFSSVEDRLLNILQLRGQLEDKEDNSLVLAGIEQKTVALKPVTFHRAINLNKNRKYLKYAAPPLLLLLALLWAAPSVITDGGSRILQNSVEFERPAPFHFVFDQAEDLTAIQFEDYEINVKTEGEFVPSQAYIQLGDVTYQLERMADQSFQFVFNNIGQDLDFQFMSGKVKSETFSIKVLEKPQIMDMSVKATYPRYLGRRSETFDNIGDLNIPIGTRLDWKLKTRNVKNIEIAFSEGKVPLEDFEQENENELGFKKRIYKSQAYTLYSSSEVLPRSDSVKYQLDVIPDRHPSIVTESIMDSVETHMRYTTGKIEDDYGLSALNIVYKIKHEDGDFSEEARESIKISGGVFASFDYLFDLDSFNLSAGEEVTYYFEVWDNDAVNGSKSAKSSVYTFYKLSGDEIEEQIEENKDDIEDVLKENVKKTGELKKDMKELREKFLNKEDLNWQDKKDLEKLLDRQEEIRKQLEEARDKLQENQQNQQENQMNEELLEKQEKIKELFDKVLDDELKQLMEEIQKLMEELNRDKSLDMMKDMEFSNEEMELELDKMLELFKQLQVEEDIQKQVEKLEEMAEKQEQLSEQSKDKNKSAEELKKEQEKLNEEFKELEKELDETKKKNEELEKPRNIEDTEKEEEEIKEEQEESSEQLDQDKKDQASKAQKKASKKMKEMAEKLSAGMEGGAMDQMGEDLETMRQLLENLLTLSFDQEQLINDLRVTKQHTPNYVLRVKEQFRIKDDFGIVRDSLQALSKRSFQLEAFIMDKVGEINRNMDKSLTALEERHSASKYAPAQRFVMKNLNDLALMLAESMEQMQKQMSGMMPGNQQCNNPKPGQGGKPMDKITEGQKGMKEKLQKMMEGMNQGEQPNSKQFAQAAAQQAALRKMLRDAQKQQSEQGKNDKLMQEIIDAMNNVEKQLVNKQLTNETMKRQQDILTRLLEAERAERQREYENKRESETGREIQREIPPAIQKYLKERQAQLRQVNRSTPSLNAYYRMLVEQYYKELGNK